MTQDIPLDTRVVLITGTAGSKKNQALTELMSRVDPEFIDFDSETISGRSAAIDQILSGVSTVPFGDGKRIVVVTHTEQLDDATQKKLALSFDKVPSSGLLILTTGEPLLEDGKAKKGSVVLTELVTAAKKKGVVTDFGAPQKEDLRVYMETFAKAHGKQLRSDAIAIFMDLPSEDVRRIESELTKVFDYVGAESVVDAEDVLSVLSRGPDEVIFKLCDAVGSRRTAEALRLLSSTFDVATRAEGVALRVLTMLARQIRLVHQAKCMVDMKLIGRGAGVMNSDVEALFPVDGIRSTLANPRMAWMADKLVTASRGWSHDGLERALDAIAQADSALKGIEPGGENAREVIEHCIILMCA